MIQPLQFEESQNKISIFSIIIVNQIFLNKLMAIDMADAPSLMSRCVELKPSNEVWGTAKMTGKNLCLWQCLYNIRQG